MVRGNLPDQQPSVVGGHGRPDPCLLRLSQPRRRHEQPCCEVLCASDARPEGLTCVQVLEHTRVSLICLAPWTGAPTLGRRWVVLQICTLRWKRNIPTVSLDVIALVASSCGL